jgi:hypothetical protein
MVRSSFRPTASLLSDIRTLRTTGTLGLPVWQSRRTERRTKPTHEARKHEPRADANPGRRAGADANRTGSNRTGSNRTGADANPARTRTQEIPRTNRVMGHVSIERVRVRPTITKQAATRANNVQTTPRHSAPARTLPHQPAQAPRRLPYRPRRVVESDPALELVPNDNGTHSGARLSIRSATRDAVEGKHT